jgi:nitrate/TMAO reductase-like tetraheme cytochrome c subunit
MARGRLRRHLGSHWGAMSIGAGLAALAIVLVLGGEAALSSAPFCLSCHSMSYPAEELRRSTHYGALGADPQCKQCHVPQGLENFHLALQTHLVDGTRELYLELTNDYSDRAKFDARRLEMAHHARMNLKRWDSVTCRDCHREPRPPGASARREHERMATEGKTCIDCHQNLVHKEVEETDLGASLRQGTLVLRAD